MYQYSKFIYVIYETAFLLDRLIDQKLQMKLSCSFSQFRVMMALDNNHNVPQRYVALYWNITEAAISRQVESLVKKGFVLRSTDAVNRRQNLLSLTTRGKALLKKSYRLVDAIFDEILEKHHHDKKREIIQALQTVAEIIHPLSQLPLSKKK